MKCSKTLHFLVLCASIHASSGVSQGNIVTQTFDELSFQPIDDLSFKGVTFDFKTDGVDSDDAKYASFGPVETEHVSDPSLVGDSRGILTLDFDIPTTFIEFGASLAGTGPISPGLTVELLDEAFVVIATIPTDAAASSTATGFSDAFFQYSGQAVKRMVIEFSDAADSFAVDNLVYNVPEPVTGSSALMIVALAILRFVRRKRTRI